MNAPLETRVSQPEDRAALEAFYPTVFPDEDLLPLVRDLLNENAGVLSLVGVSGQALVGHVAFTVCGIAESAETVALLGPLGVAPARQGQGIGSALVQEGFRRLKETGATRVYVLGDPAYYGRFGFMPEESVTPPFPLPEEWRGAWQSRTLSDDLAPLRGVLVVPQPWRQPALWTS